MKDRIKARHREAVIHAINRCVRLLRLISVGPYDGPARCMAHLRTGLMELEKTGEIT